ncbi:hypothetical protein J6590_005301 [Homalodisca vitripennis]|nr:hypothetical protein J6590_005301 [Homalodisca vitripennis]
MENLARERHPHTPPPPLRLPLPKPFTLIAQLNSVIQSRRYVRLLLAIGDGLFSVRVVAFSSVLLSSLSM